MMAIVVFLASCKEVPMEEQISRLYESSSPQDETTARIEKAESLDQSDLWDYYSYLLAKEAGVKLGEIYDEEDGLLTARYFGRNKKDISSVTMTARLDEYSACITAIEVLKLYKNSKIRPNHNIRLVIYADSTAVPVSMKSNNLLLMNLHCSDTLEKHTFIIREAEPIYQKIMEVIPPYFQPYGSYTFKNEARTKMDAIYDYNVSKEDLGKETATVASLIHILN